MRLNANKLFLTLAIWPLIWLAQTLATAQQALVNDTAPVTATAEFDPPIAAVGQRVFYRVNVTAAEATIAWPDNISAPPELKLATSVRGQMLLPLGGGEHPLTAFVYEVNAASAGVFTLTNFGILANGQPIMVPTASVEIRSQPTDQAAERELTLETSVTNLYVGQPFQIRLRLPAAAGNQVDFRDIHLNDQGLLMDKTWLRQALQSTNQNGKSVVNTVTELMVTPITVGARTFTAQAFTTGRNFSGAVTLSGQVTLVGGGNAPKYLLYVSAPKEINVRPLPATGELPGFTGTIGKFFLEPPKLATNQLRLGEPVHLKISFISEGELTRFVPPVAPRSRDWQIIEDPAPATGFTLIPLTDEARTTPPIPFSSFDPATGKYIDLTIPPMRVTVTAEGLPVQLPTYDEASKTTKPLRLSEPALTAGRRVASLKPLQLQSWFIGVQLLPVAGFLALWQWDRRRRFLAAHPEIVRRRNALHALRRSRRKLQTSVAANDSAAFVRHAAEAFQIAVAPHYPANPAALVGGDVLAQLEPGDQASRLGQTVRNIFAAADTKFAATPPAPKDLLAAQAAVLDVLRQLEGRL